MVARLAVAPVVLGALLLAAGVARAQTAPPVSPAPPLPRPWEDPDAVDIDDKEPRSRFWDRTVHPHRERFERELKLAGMLLASRRPDDHHKAEEVLAAAVKLEPDDPRGHFYLGHAYFLQRKWSECAAAEGKAAALDPGFEPGALPGAPAAMQVPTLDVGLAQCLSLAGDHEAAIVRFHRAIGRIKARQLGQASIVPADIYWHLGESYMALGRLEHAIGALRRAVDQTWNGVSRPRDMLPIYALAAAYDRDEQIGAARALLEKLAPWEGSMNTFSRTDLRISPPEDIYYYKALLYETPTHVGERILPGRSPEHALVLFRNFLRLHGNGPWSRRARAHIAALVRDPLSPKNPQQDGGRATVDAGQARAAIARVDEALQRCVKEVPLALFEVQITLAVTGKRKRREEPVMLLGGASPRAPGVKATASADHTGDAAAVAGAVQCLDDVAATIKLPAPRGAAGDWVTVSFPVVWQGP